MQAPPGTFTQTGTFDALIAAVAPGGAGIAYSRYLGGSATDVGTSIAADAAGNAYVAGFTASTDFPTAGPLQPGNHGGSYDAFVAKLGSPAPPTATPTATNTGTPTATNTATNTPTRTPTYTPIPLIATSTSTPSSTPTATATNTGTPTSTPTATSTNTPSRTPTTTAAPSATATAMGTATGTATSTFTSTATATSTSTATATPSSTPPMRTLTYTYDGLQRLIGAVDSPGSSYAYQYDVAGNRTDVTTNGTLTQHRAYDATNQLQSGSPPTRGYPPGRQPAHRRQRHLQLQRRRHPGRLGQRRRRHRLRPGPRRRPAGARLRCGG